MFFSEKYTKLFCTTHLSHRFFTINSFDWFVVFANNIHYNMCCFSNQYSLQNLWATDNLHAEKQMCLDKCVFFLKLQIFSYEVLLSPMKYQTKSCASRQTTPQFLRKKKRKKREKNEAQISPSSAHTRIPNQHNKKVFQYMLTEHFLQTHVKETQHIAQWSNQQPWVQTSKPEVSSKLSFTSVIESTPYKHSDTVKNLSTVCALLSGFTQCWFTVWIFNAIRGVYSLSL